MKAKTLKIKFETWEDFKHRSREELQKVITTKKKAIQSEDVLVFGSVAAYQKFMSEQKYMILAAIHNLKPTSVYQLAKLVQRDFPNVKKDCDGLVASGFIVLEESGDNRNTRMPRLKFEYDTIEIHLPNMIYSHNLGEVAA
jgi:predicted transcriptional regulator